MPLFEKSGEHVLKLDPRNSVERCRRNNTELILVMIALWDN